MYGQNPIPATSANTGSLTLDIEYNKNGAYGGMALAFGIYAPIDRGDLPVSFGTAQHRLTFQSINSCNFNPPYPTQQSSQALKLGAVAGDADGQQTTDDNAVGADEDAFTTFPNYNGGGTYSLMVPLSNTSGASAYLYGWFDKNNDKQFTPDERAGAVVANNGTSAILTWTGLPAELPVTGTADYHDFGLRLRFSSDQAAAQNAVGSAPDGEVEDYLVPMYIPCTFTMPAGRTIPLCAGTTVQLNASNPKAVRYRWTGIGLSNDAVANPTVTPAVSTVYDVVATDLRGCSDDARFTIDVHPSPVITTANSVRICKGLSTTLSASAAVNAAFKWSPATGLSDANVSNPTASPAANTNYTVTATSADNCIATATVAVNVMDAPEFEVTPASQTACAGETVAFKASGGDIYTWRAPDNTVLGSGDALTVRPGASGTYSVEIEDQVCHTDKIFNLPVAVIPLPQASVAKSNDLDCTHGSAVLTATGGLTYTWEPANGLRATNGARVTVAPPEPTMYYVNISNGGKCVKRDSVFVDFNANSELSSYPMPNAFTPNNDGQNDCFGLKQWGPVLALDFAVYNRWGETVFRTNDPLQCWDGTFKGAAQPAGTYVFVIKARTACGNGERKGTVVLVR
ncbi:gliding motility-associated C-terminal domain-containing protein [Chitinophaga sedimenti]|uniref:T9SS type B sorting domain-containing protein n=1 Tax=Chitinophaga sedimenti TaxID=2033606 RepID=UPI003558284C